MDVAQSVPQGGVIYKEGSNGLMVVLVKPTSSIYSPLDSTHG